MKRAQIEIIGLVVIVLFISIALLLYVSNATEKTLTNTGNNLYTSYSSNEIATSFLQAYLQTYIVDCEATIEELIKDCGRSRSLITCRGETSCDALEQSTADILAASIDEWGYPYLFTLSYTPDEQFSVSTFDCTADVNKAAPGVFLVPYHPEPGVARLELGFCR